MSPESRIESLEYQVRTLKRMLFGVFGLVVVGGLLAATTLQSVPDVIRAKKFEAVNDAGKVLAAINADVVGGVVNVFDKDGNRAAVLRPYLTGGALYVFNKGGKTGAGIGVDVEGGVVAVFNNDDRSVASITARASGGYVATYDSKGARTSKAP